MKHIFANWKMYLDFDESNILMNQLVVAGLPEESVDITVFPSAIATADCIKAVHGTAINVGTQNVAWTERGAYTGAVSARMYKDLGCTHALVGHSERRYVFGETNEDVRKKVEACFDVGLIPVVCIGETADDKEQNKGQYRLKKELLKAFDGLDLKDKTYIIAYEPVWAVGTGKPCDPLLVDEVHMWIQEEMKQYSGERSTVLYGGSINTENVVKYLASKNIDGILVGGASAKFDTLEAIIRSAEKFS